MSKTAAPYDDCSYVGICPGCGAMSAACVDRPEWKKDTAKFLANMVREGLRVERVSNARVRIELSSCKCNEKPAPAVTGSLFPEESNV